MADAKLDAARRELAAQIAADIDALGANWVRPWVSQAPRNPLSGTAYKGRNALLLTHIIRKHRFSDHRFMTFTQARKAALIAAATAAGRASDWLFDHCFSEAGNGGAEAGAA